jgi:hypothetical protein
MLITYTMHKAGHEPVDSVYPVDLPAWIADGWTSDPLDAAAVEVVEETQQPKIAKSKVKAVTPEA